MAVYHGLEVSEQAEDDRGLAIGFVPVHDQDGVICLHRHPVTGLQGTPIARPDLKPNLATKAEVSPLREGCPWSYRSSDHDATARHSAKAFRLPRPGRLA